MNSSSFCRWAIAVHTTNTGRQAMSATHKARPRKRGRLCILPTNAPAYFRLTPSVVTKFNARFETVLNMHGKAENAMID